MLQQALLEFGKLYPKEPLRGKFADAMAFQARVLNDLQRSVMKIRMVPVDQMSHGSAAAKSISNFQDKIPTSTRESSMQSPSR